MSCKMEKQKTYIFECDENGIINDCLLASLYRCINTIYIAMEKLGLTEEDVQFFIDKKGMGVFW